MCRDGFSWRDGKRLSRLLNTGHREKDQQKRTSTRTESRGDQRRKRTKKALERRVRKMEGSEGVREGEWCDSEGQRKAVKVAKQAAERGT